MKYNFNGFTTKANEALNQAISSAENLGHTYVGSEHLLLGLLKIGGGFAAALLNKSGITAEGVEELIRAQIGCGTPTKLSPDYFTPRAKRAVENAMASCANNGKKYVGTEHLLLGILSDGDNYAIRFLSELGADAAALTRETLKASDIDGYSGEGKPKTYQKPQDDKVPTLSKYGRELTAEAKKCKLDPVIGREKEIERVIQILCRRTKNNPCLIGEPGVGKTAIAEGLAQKIADGDVDDKARQRLFVRDVRRAEGEAAVQKIGVRRAEDERHEARRPIARVQKMRQKKRQNPADRRVAAADKKI